MHAVGRGGGGRCERQQSLLNLELKRMDVNDKLVVIIKFIAVILFICAIDIAICVLNLLH